MGVPPQAGSGCQPTASAAEEASSRSGIPNAAFTPGPWTVPSASFPEDSKGVAYHVCAENICMSAANARLIAAAPELYEALDLFVREYVELVESGDAGFWDAEKESKVVIARAALAKARGGKCR